MTETMEEWSQGETLEKLMDPWDRSEELGE